jgi:hypothetical protein
MTNFQWIAFSLGFILQVMVLTLLVRHFARQYPFLLLLVATEFLGAAMSAAAQLEFVGWTDTTIRFYWVSEGVHFALMFFCLTQMLYQTLGDKGSQRLPTVLLGGLLFSALCTAQAYHTNLNYWMTQLVRNFSFGSMFVALMVWTLSIRNPNKQRLLIVAGLGIQLAGSAIGHSLRQLSRSTVQVGNVILTVCYLLFLYTLWRALRSRTVLQTVVPTPPPSVPLNPPTTDPATDPNLAQLTSNRV